MPEITPADPAAQIAAWKRDIERRLRNLEQPNQLSSASFVGRTRILDGDGNTIGVLGELVVTEPGGATSDETGVLIQNAGGADVFLATDQRGLITPVPQFEWRRPQDTVIVTSASYVDVFQAIPVYMTGTGIDALVAIATDAATDGNVRLKLTDPSGTNHFSSARYLPGSSSDYYRFLWDLEAAAGMEVGDGTFFVTVQVRRTSGVGNVHVFQPLPMIVRDAGYIGATPTGV